MPSIHNGPSISHSASASTMATTTTSAAFALTLIGLFAAVASKNTCPGGWAGCPDYDVIEKFDGMELRRYRKSVLVSAQVPNADYISMMEIGYERLMEYFDGVNYDRKALNKTTPMRIQFDVWNLRDLRFASFYVPKDAMSEPPTPMYPISIRNEDEKFFYVKTFSDILDFREVTHYIATMMADLSVDGQPFSLNKCFIALYKFPRKFGAAETDSIMEVWIERAWNTGPYTANSLNTDLSQILNKIDGKAVTPKLV